MNLKVAPVKYLLEDLTRILSGDSKGFQNDSPSKEIELGEQVIGTLEDSIARGLWNLNHKIRTSIREEVDQPNSSFDPEDRTQVEKIFQTVDNAADIADVSNKLFWLRLHMMFPFAHKPGLTVGVRNGWRVVVMKSSDSALDVLRKLLGPSGD